MDSRNIVLKNLIYQGGDDCIAIKPRSYNIEVRNVTCRGGNGIAIGSLGQYLEDSSVEHVVVSDVKVCFEPFSYSIITSTPLEKT
jgi:galacturan 1,4-alpha-galacturonidase